MNLEEALMHFELEKGASLFQVEEKYEGLKQQYELLMANAPNPTVLRVYQKNLDDLTTAYNFALTELKAPMSEELACSVIGVQVGTPLPQVDEQYKNIKFELEAGMKMPDKAVQAECRYELSRLEEAYAFLKKVMEERAKKAQFISCIRLGDQYLADNDFEQAAKQYKEAGKLINEPIVQQKLQALEALKKKVTEERISAFIWQADEHSKKENYPQAIASLMQALELDPASAVVKEKIQKAEELEREKVRKIREEKERKEREERERKEREERERKEREERERKEREEKERKEREEKERKQKEQEEAQRKQAEKEKREREEKALLEKQEKEKAALAAKAQLKKDPEKTASAPKEEKQQSPEVSVAPKKNSKVLVMAAVVVIIAAVAGYIIYSTHLATVVFTANKNATLTLGGGTTLELTANNGSEAKIAPGEYEFSAEDKETAEIVNGTFKVEGRFGEVSVIIPFAAGIQIQSAQTDTSDATNTETAQEPAQINSSEIKSVTTNQQNTLAAKEQQQTAKQENTNNAIVAVNTPPVTSTTTNNEKSSSTETDETEFNLWWMGLNASWKNILLKAARISDVSSKENKLQIINIRKLDIGNQKVTSLEPLEELTQLRELTCMESNIESLEPLRRLKKLEYLWLAKNKVSNLEPISGLTKLKTLNVQKNNLSSIEPLRNLTNLETLFINYNNIGSLKPLYGLTKLKSIAVKFNACSEAEIDALKAQLPGATFSSY